MLSRWFYSLIAALFIVGFAYLIQPQTANAGAAVPGCCITNGGQCSPSCGPAGSSCQNPDISSAGGQCKGAAIPDLYCFQITSNSATCGEGMPPTGCKSDGECDDSNVCTDDSCVDAICQNVFNSSNGTGDECSPLIVGPSVIVPTMGQWGMLLAAIVLGLFAVIRLRSLKDSDLS